LHLEALDHAKTNSYSPLSRFWKQARPEQEADMLRPTRVFRLFVSSTFADFRQERDALHTRVFPMIRRFCVDRGARFDAVDLRWGISQEAARDQRTMRVCLEEVRRCQAATQRPNFLIVLGDRYGWSPLPPEVPVNDFARIRDVAAHG